VTVVRTAVDGERHVHGVALASAHPVRPPRVDGHELVERVGVVAAPLLVRPDDVDPAGLVGITPHEAVERHLRDREDPLVDLRPRLFVRQHVRTVERAPLEVTHLVEQRMERLAQLTHRRSPIWIAFRCCERAPPSALTARLRCRAGARPPSWPTGSRPCRPACAAPSAP
jgi:hypothetical protein